MTTLERLAFAVSARLSGDDLVLVLDYAAALERGVRSDALRDVLVALADPAHHPWAAEAVVRGMIEQDRADG